MTRFGTAAEWLASMAAAGMLAICAPATAADDQRSYPYITGEVDIEVQNDGFYHSEDPTAEIDNLTTDTEPLVIVHLTENLLALAHATLEQSRLPPPGRNGFFARHGIFMEALNLQYVEERFSLLGGKFGVNFGRAWDVAPGIYGTDFAEGDYQFDERIGFSGTANTGPGELGTHTVSASTFFSDTSVFSGAYPSTRGTLVLSDGGPGNTESFSSWSVALDSSDAMGVAGMTYHAAFIYQESGVGDTADERGYAAGLSFPVEVGGEVTFTPFVEWTRLTGVGGFDGAELVDLTLSLQGQWRGWGAALSYTGRDNGDTAPDDSLFQASAGYTFDFGIGVQLAWRLAEVAQIESNAIGTLLT